MRSVTRRPPPFPARAFQPSADRGSLWLVGQYDDALRMLRSAVLGRQGLLALVGEPGTGKTVLAHALTVRLQEDDILVGRLLYPILEGMDLRAAIAEAFGLSAPLDTGESFVDQLHRFIADTSHAGRRVLLLVDQAQQLSSELLVELARTPAAVPLSVLLVGQRSILETLRADGLEPDVLCHLQPLTREQTAEYIAYRLRAAGHSGRQFTASALRKIWVVSEGIPRLINTLCIESLGGVQATSPRKVTASLVHRTSRDDQHRVPSEAPVTEDVESAELMPPVVTKPRRRLRSLMAAAIAATVVVAWVATGSDRAPWLSARPDPTTASTMSDDAAKREAAAAATPDAASVEAAALSELIGTPEQAFPTPVSPATVVTAAAASSVEAAPAPAVPAPKLAGPRPQPRPAAIPPRPIVERAPDGDAAAAIDWLLKKQRSE